MTQDGQCESCPNRREKVTPQQALVSTAVVCLIILALVGTAKLVLWVWGL